MENKSFVMLTLTEYEAQKAEKADLENRMSQVANHLMKFESFLKMMDGNDKVIESFNNNLETTQKIGTALFMTFEEVKEGLNIDLKK